MTAGSELEAIINPANQAAGEQCEACIYVIMCIFEKLYRLHYRLRVLMSSGGSKWIARGLGFLPRECKECVQLL